MTTMDNHTQPDLASLLANGYFAGEWVLDGDRSHAEFRTRSMWGLARVKGRFGALAGAARVTKDGAITGTLTIDVASLRTRNRIRDKHLLSRGLFDAKAHPSIRYSLRRVDVGRGAVTGGLAVHGVERELEVAFAVQDLGDGLVVLTGRATVDRSDFGITWSPLRMASMRNEIAITTVFHRV
jgi:polyisoprenoid-binding protein YceI